MKIGTKLALLAIRVYQGFVSALMPMGCRFYPTCSHYAAEAVEKHGAGRGLWLAAKRILRCRPFGAGGYDPVPEREEFERHLHGHEVNGA